MAVSFEEAFEIARKRYRHQINHFEEYEKYVVFFNTQCSEYTGGDYSPIVIRKSDGRALLYAPIFFNFDADAEDVGEIIAEGVIDY